MVFDGYESGSSTKDETHQRREGTHSFGPEVNFKPNMKMTMKKKAFLANQKNKQKRLYFLSTEMEKAGIEVPHSSSDADYDIVAIACKIAMKRPVTVVGDDTDLLILLLHHLRPVHH